MAKPAKPSKASQPSGKSGKSGENYQQLSIELATVMAELEQGDLEIDDAVRCYERGLELVKLLENHLTKAENRVTKLKASLELDEEEE